MSTRIARWTIIVLALTTACDRKPDSVGAGDPKLVGEWRILSERISLDAGGSRALEKVTATQILSLKADGRWGFETSSGTWRVAPIADADWKRWAIDAYGPKRKLILDGWNKGSSEGPIEESGSSVDYVWVIYHVDKPDPGTIWMKLGRR